MFERYRIGSKNVVNLIVLLEYCSLSSPVNLMQSVEHWETVNKLGITIVIKRLERRCCMIVD